MRQNAIPKIPDGDSSDRIAARIAQRALAKRGAEYAGEVRRLLDAALVVMRRCGTTSRPRVTDIVAEAGLSNEVFYRHFPSKDALVAALLEDGTARLRSYLAHQMAKEPTPQGQVRRWVEGLLAQAADEEIASTTLTVLWNAGSLGESQGDTWHRPSASAPLAELLRAPFLQLGSADPHLDASLAGHALVGQLSDHLWDRTRPSSTQIDHITGLWLAAVAGAPPS